MTHPYADRHIHKDPVTVGTTATPLLTEAEGSTMGMRTVYVLPASDIYVGGADVTATNGALLCLAGISTEIVHKVGQLYGVAASGTVSTRVQIGCG